MEPSAPTSPARTRGGPAPRVVVAVGSLRGGGAERTSLSLVRGLEREGVEAHLALARPEGDWAALGIDPRRLHEVGEEQEARRVEELARDLGAELIVTNRPAVIRADPRPLTLVTVHNTPSSRTRRRSPWRRARRFRELRELYADRHLIAQSRGMARDLLERVRVRPASLVVIENPFELQAIRAAGAVPRPVEAPPSYLLHVGSFRRYKRHDTLLAAYARSGLQQPLVLLGKDMGDGSDEERVRRLVARLDLGQRVRLVGWHPDPYPWMAHASLLVLSSESEGSPRVLVEALALGTPVVSTDCPSGPAEILTGDLARYLVPVGDRRALARAMVRAVQAPADFSDLDLGRFDHRDVARRFVAHARGLAARAGTGP